MHSYISSMYSDVFKAKMVFVTYICNRAMLHRVTLIYFIFSLSCNCLSLINMKTRFALTSISVYVNISCYVAITTKASAHCSRSLVCKNSKQCHAVDVNKLTSTKGSYLSSLSPTFKFTRIICLIVDIAEILLRLCNGLSTFS